MVAVELPWKFHGCHIVINEQTTQKGPVVAIWPLMISTTCTCETGGLLELILTNKAYLKKAGQNISLSHQSMPLFCFLHLKLRVCVSRATKAGSLRKHSHQHHHHHHYCNGHYNNHYVISLLLFFFFLVARSIIMLCRCLIENRINLPSSAESASALLRKLNKTKTSLKDFLVRHIVNRL